MVHDTQAMSPPSTSSTTSDTSFVLSKLVSWSPYCLSSFESSSGYLSPITSCDCDVCTLEAGPNAHFDTLRNEEMAGLSSEYGVTQPLPTPKDLNNHHISLAGIFNDSIVTDIILKIKPEHMVNICSRIKNYEYRKYLLPSTTLRIWFNEISPIEALTYVATIGTVRTPGEVQDQSGLGNNDFDAR
jgi:hypothetical protein